MRALARWGITPLLAAPFGAWALGLGDIELESGLNQPFRARIALSATADELQGLRVALAPVDTFARYGLERPAFFSSFQFRVVTERDGRSAIQVTSADSIVEPFVTLLLEASWPRGRTLREYTVLLDPPVLLPAPAAPPALRPAETRQPSSAAPGGQINRPAPTPAPAPAPSRSVEPATAPPTSSAPPAMSSAEPGGTYGPVQPAETLWAIAERLRPAGVTTNQMMIAVYEANQNAFGGNINLLRAGVTLRVPTTATLQSMAVTAANAEVQRQADAWRDRAGTAQNRQLRLLPPTETTAAVPAPTAPAAPAPQPAAAAAGGGSASAAAAAAAAAAAEESRRLLEVRAAELERLQQQAAAPAAEPPVAEAEPGVELESEQLFADETPEDSAPAQVEAPAPAAVAPAPAPQAASSEPSLMSQLLGWVLSPILWIGLGVAALLFSALWFVRRRRQEVQDVTGRWEALESEIDAEDPDSREATARLRRQAPEDTIVVEEQHAEAVRPSKPEPVVARAAAPRSARPTPAADETLSSQTVINLDQADAIAEADFHIAYGLYDQAAELVQKALDAAPGRRDLKLKLLEVFFMWGNKEAFLKAAQGLRADIGSGGDPDWDKVVIMGRQICPDERLFTEATTGAGSVDVDLEAGDSPLDLAFDDGAADEPRSSTADELDFNFEPSDVPPAPRPAARPPPRDYNDDSLDIGAKTAAGLEAALFEAEQEDDEDTGRRTTPDLPADSLAVTQESPTIERPRSSDWSSVTAESPTLQYAADAPTVETPTIESPAARSAATKTMAIPRRNNEPPTIEQPSLSTVDFTAEIDLDDLGLDVKDLEGLPSDLGDLPTAGGAETDTREQRALRVDDALLSATGITKVLDSDDEFATSHTSVLEDQDATLLAPSFDDDALTGTEVLHNRQEVDDETGSTSLVRSLRVNDGGVDLDLEDLTMALHGADTVEQPRSSSFSHDVFGGGDTPLDIDIGRDLTVDDEPTGTEDVGSLDPQTMTEIGTKLDLARAYIDMGDPEGARSILEEVLDEGDPGQRREAQGLIDVLSA